MKNLFFTTCILVFLSSCTKPTDLQVHPHVNGDVYCSYTAKGAGDGTFKVCVYCPKDRAECATIKEARLLREGTTDQYDVFDLTPIPGAIGCDVCTGDYYWEKK